AGKSHVIAEFVRQALAAYSSTRIILLQHVKELLQQNTEKIFRHLPLAPVGIYSAGLRSKKTDQITVASIQSIYRRACDMDPFDLAMIDECHLVPRSGNGRYLSFLRDLKLCNPKLKVIGFTASPFR